MAEEPKKKDFWDKIAIVLHPLGGLLTAFAVAFVGMKGSQLLERRQSVDTNARLYSELMSRREEAESSLRKDMFVSIIASFLEPKGDDLSAKVLNLELLAYNFHDSLNLKPLFLEMQRRLRKSADPERGDYLQRINRVAREINAKQLFALEGHGKSFRRSVDFEELAAAGAGGIALEPETVTVRRETTEVGLRVLKVDLEQQQLTVRMKVTSPDGREEVPESRASFTVGFYDFPVIDNTRLPSGTRCAVTLSNFSPVAADITAVCFPGEYASLKDRPYYDEVIQKLREANEAEKASVEAEAL
ncbi:MAG: hypothetical protein BroJett010_02870 [Gammaproteobacteria bacterium]|nr:hypothetical protein [Gammaproteobacteria bacterium]GIK33728.1 MAG: hypothetical protein BroJett010_02870 [Gammaproteobacteria bacterium]